jgi:hypothetical protein
MIAAIRTRGSRTPLEQTGFEPSVPPARPRKRVNAVGVTNPSLWQRVAVNNRGLDVYPFAKVEGEALTLA